MRLRNAWLVMTIFRAVLQVRSLSKVIVDPSEKETEAMKMTSLKSKRVGRIEVMTPTIQLVRIEFTEPSAFKVWIAGAVNEWHLSATQMVALRNGRWVKELTLQSDTHDYHLVEDDEWRGDPRALKSAPDPSCGVNSVLRVLPVGESNGRPPTFFRNTKATDK